jgi:hypothetical protein
MGFGCCAVVVAAFDVGFPVRTRVTWAGSLESRGVHVLSTCNTLQLTGVVGCMSVLPRLAVDFPTLFGCTPDGGKLQVFPRIPCAIRC